MSSPPFTPVYHDRLLRLILVPLLGILYRHIGEPSPLVHLLRDPVYYLDLLVATLSLWGNWELTRFLIRRLDRRFSWMSDFFQRLVIQSVAVYGIITVLVILITFVYNDIVMKDHREAVFNVGYMFVTDMPVAWLILTIIQLFYYAMYLQSYYQQELAMRGVVSSREPEQPASTTRKNVLVYFGKSLLPVALEEIAYFHKIGEVTLVRTRENQDYRIDQTLEQLTTTLPAGQFYRLNRRMIANMEAVREVKSDASGKLFVTLEPAYDDEVTVSRKKAAEFKNWLNG